LENSIIGFLVISVVSYLAGSITGAFYIIKWQTGQDIRKIGSKNVGATNAGRILGKKGFLLTLLIDAAKVFITLFLVKEGLAGSDFALILSAVFLCIGHLFPIQLRFHGGKGVVVYLASALFLVPLTIGAAAAVMGAAYLLLHRYKTAGFLAMTSIPVAAFLIEDSFILPSGLLFLFITVILSHNK
jgi:acyl phosphate:glycerol-3-phosphate acyltransferase